jgi:glycogen(starch) synthase
MRILFWSDLAWPHIGGVELLTHKLMIALRERGHTLALITSHADLTLPDERAEDGILVRRFAMQEAISQQRLDALARIKRQIESFKGTFRPDIIHVNFPSPSILLHWMTDSDVTAPTLLSIHHTLSDFPAGPETLIGRSLARAAWIVANSRFTSNEALHADPKIAEHCSVIYNGIDSPVGPSVDLPWNPPRLVCLGRMTRNKGFDIALKAFAEARRLLPDIRMTIAGNGPELESLMALADNLEIRDRVDFPGWVAPDAVAGLMASATLVVVPSIVRESFGLVAIEAMQHARPVIAAASGALAEIVFHQETGLVVPPGDVAALAKAFEQLLSNRELAAQMGAAGHHRALAHFGFARYVNEYESVYAQLHAAQEGVSHARPGVD